MVVFLSLDLTGCAEFTSVSFLYCSLIHLFKATAPFSLHAHCYFFFIILLPNCISWRFPLVFQSPPLSSPSTLFTFHLASIIATQPPHPLPPPLTFFPSSPLPPPPPPPLFLLLHSRHSELFSMSSFIAGARSQLQLITEHRAGGTRSAFRSALSLHFAINPFHTIPTTTTTATSSPSHPTFYT